MATIVLVHGVWMDASVWRDVIPALQQAGHSVHGVQLPLTSFEDDVAATRRVLGHAAGDITLVGHSYGGAVITAAAAEDARVKKLVYIAGLAAEAGEVFGALMGMKPPAAQIDLQPDAEGFLWVTAEQFQDALAHDVPHEQIALLTAVQKPYAAKLFGASLPLPAWKTRPSWYLVAAVDRILSPTTQRILAQRIGATMREVDASHTPQLSKPQAVLAIIQEAAAA